MNTFPPSLQLLAALEKAGVPRGVIAKTLVVSPSAVSALYAGGRQLKHDEAVKLLRLLPGAAGVREVALIGMAGAGKWLEAIEEAKDTITVPFDTPGRFAVEVVGDSMNKVLPEGSIAIVDPTDTDLYVGKLYLLRNGDGEATIKRYRADPARFEPVSDNPTYVPFSIGSTDFKVIGRITGGFQRF